jgi:hypothetical protein
METVNQFIRENAINIGKNVYVTPNIPEKKLNNAVEAMGCESLMDSVIAIQDATVFGSATEGFIFTGERMIHHDYGEVLYKDIQSIEITREKNDKGKVEVAILVKRSSGFDKLQGLKGIDSESFAEFLTKIVTDYEEFEEEKQILELSSMTDDFKKSYLKVIANMTFDDDQDIDADELSEIFLLMTRLGMSSEARFDLRGYIENITPESKEQTADLVSSLKELSDSSQHKAIMISLVKDIINTHYSAKDIFDGDVAFVSEYKNILGLTDEELDFVYQAVKDGFDILRDETDDNKIKETASRLASSATAVGAPIAAVYISGSVVGLSAAGVTSGLATLGLGMGMSGGLAALGAIGFLSYKGVRHFSGAGELDKFKIKQKMLTEALKQTHVTIQELIADINYLVLRLNKTIDATEDSQQKINFLEAGLSKIVSALQKSSEKADKIENALNRSKCPKTLDHNRFFELTNEPAKKELYNHVMEFYSEKVIDGKKTFVLQEMVPTSKLDEMYEILEMTGYFEIAKSLGANTKSFVKNLKGNKND